MAYISFQPNDYFNTKLYTGNATDNHAITGVGFAPDFTWIKNRANAYDHMLFDALRGTGSLRENLRSNTNDASDNDATNLKTLDSDGFTLGTGGYVNHASTFVSWNWKANGAGVSNTDGSITSTVSANTTSGFSIVKYTNPSSGSPFTVGHGLGSPPKVIIVKNITGSAQNWGVWHTGIAFGKYLQLNTTIAEGAANLVTATSNTTFSTYYDHHTSGVDLIAYCFAEKTGFSKFGLYQGNSNADGAFIYTGFKPAWVMIKQATGGDANEVWGIRDNVRDTFNPITKSLVANATSAEGTTSSHYVDFVSNGFKIRTGTENSLNTNYGYIYMAFAEAPLVSSNGVPVTAR